MERFAPELSKFKAISVRENSAKDIVKKMIGTDAEVVVDPVFLLSPNQWNKAINYKLQAETPYIAFYFLGDTKNECIQKVLSDLKKDNYVITDILQMNREKKGCVGPAEFVGIIRESKFVLTDSFHATVFSIIYHVPFLVVDRSADKNAGDMSARLSSLLKMFGFENRLVRSVDELNHINYTCDFSHVDAIIGKERKKAVDYLLRALD